ncbi:MULTISPECIES: helix-turn-helix domain-containing protein [Enterococcus]|nr:helix-turn-helix transcriptional regulator [Enterococcus faecalis]MCU9781810.1 helix-turn-helix domain-containing protein [Enterococcus faecalis]MCU9796533.1 helix-turn-helix domain-containing protein [Enterococcus faecalis]MDN3183880.1 helix-turn-helix transcriptional regulator [Enterococcus faecalis]
MEYQEMEMSKKMFKQITDKDKAIGRNIKNIRLDRGMTQEEFSKLFDPSPGTSVISKWERGATVPSPQRLKRLAEIAETTVEEILTPPSQNQYTGALANVMAYYEDNKSEIPNDLTNAYLLQKIFVRYLQIAKSKDKEYLTAFEDLLHALDQGTSREYFEMFGKNHQAAREAIEETVVQSLAKLEIGIEMKKW